MDVDDDDNNRSYNSGSHTAMLPIFGSDSMREPQLEPSILGSIISALDPDPPQPARNHKMTLTSNSDNDNNSTQKNSKSLVAANDHATPAATCVSATPGSKRLLPTGSTPDGEATLAEERPRAWAGGGGGGSGMAGSVAAGVVGGQGGMAGQRAEAARRRPRVKHGLRVLLRGASRCGTVRAVRATAGTAAAGVPETAAIAGCFECALFMCCGVPLPPLLWLRSRTLLWESGSFTPTT